MMQGIVESGIPGRPTDHLFRVSLKAFIQNEKGEVLVVKEKGRDWWDLPGGGMDHGDTFQTTLARELEEEIGYKGDFTYEILDADDPRPLKGLDMLQVRLIFRVVLQRYELMTGVDGDETAYVYPVVFEQSSDAAEQNIYRYWQSARE